MSIITRNFSANFGNSNINLVPVSNKYFDTKPSKGAIVLNFIITFLNIFISIFSRKIETFTNNVNKMDDSKFLFNRLNPDLRYYRGTSQKFFKNHKFYTTTNISIFYTDITNFARFKYATAKWE